MARVSRRMFLKGAASATALPQVIAATALGERDRPLPSERATLGHIGVGARGSHIVPWFGPGAQSVACADPFKSRREAIAKQIGGKAYADLRELLARDDIQRYGRVFQYGTQGLSYDGHAEARTLPLTWSETTNVTWKVRSHDHEWSSPVIWEGQIWMTTATRDGRLLFAVGALLPPGRRPDLHGQRPGNCILH